MSDFDEIFKLLRQDVINPKTQVGRIKLHAVQSEKVYIFENTETLRNPVF